MYQPLMALLLYAREEPRLNALHTTNAELLASTSWEKFPPASLARDLVDAEVSYPL